MTSARREHLKKLQKAYLAKQRTTRRGKYTRMLQAQKEIREQYPESEYDVEFKGEQATVTLKPEVAQARYREEIRQQYPASLYDVQFVGGEAKITPRPQVTLPTKPQRYGTLEPEARQAFEAIEQRRAIGKWTAPTYRAVTKRQPSIAEYDVPYSIEPKLATPTPTVAPTLFADYMRTKEKQPPALFAEYMKTRELEREPPKTVTEQFWGFLTEPRITRYEGYGELEVLGSPVGGGVVARTMTHFVKTGEATVGEFEEHVLKQPTVRSDLMSPEELAVTYVIIGTVAVVKFGPKLGKWFSGTRVGETIKFSRVAKTFETVKLNIKSKLPSWKGSRADVWLAKKSKLYYSKTRGVSPQEVGLKPFEMVTKRGTTLPKTALSDLKATDIYWEMIQAPRTGGVMIGKSPLTTKGLQTYTFEWIMKGGQLVPRFRPQRAEPYMPTQREQSKSLLQMFKPVKTTPYTPIYQRGLLPFVTQQQVTRMGIIPYRAPYIGGRTTLTISRQIIAPTLVALGVGLTKKLRFKPKFQPLEWQPTLAREREKFRTLTLQLQKQKQKQKQLLIFPRLQILQLKHQPLRQIYRPKLKERQALPLPYLTVPRAVVKQEQKIVVTPKQIQTPKYVYPPKLVPPQPTPPIIPPFRTPIGGADVSREAKGLFGKWFKRTHPIKSAREMWKSFSGKKRKRGKGGVSLRF